MKLSCKVKLDCSHDQFEQIRATLAASNTAANVASNFAYDNKIFSRNNIHKHVYHDMRKQFGLSAQAVVRAIGKVADAYKLNKKHHQFKPHGACAFDKNNLSFSKDKSSISIRLLAGRIKIPLVLANYQNSLIQFAKGESDLSIKNNKAYLSVTCEIKEAELLEHESFMGVDLGIVNLAVDSLGHVYSGEQIDNVRERISQLRAALQSKGTKSAKRHLMRLGRKESQFRRHVNHVISKQLVERAKDTHACLVLEELKGIRKHVKKVRRAQRARHSGWAFSQLRIFISYKALRSGVPLMIVRAAYSSQECSACHHIDKRNRIDREHFLCVACGHTENADLNASKIIAYRASVNKPIVSSRSERTDSDANASSLVLEV